MTSSLTVLDTTLSSAEAAAAAAEDFCCGDVIVDISTSGFETTSRHVGVFDEDEDEAAR